MERPASHGGMRLGERTSNLVRDSRSVAPQITLAHGQAERLIGSMIRECLDHVIVSGEQHLPLLLGLYQWYYNDTPNPSVTRQGFPGAEVRPCHWEHSSIADPRRISSPLCPDQICESRWERDRAALPESFALTDAAPAGRLTAFPACFHRELMIL